MSADTTWDPSYDTNGDGGTTNDSQPLTPPPDPSGGTGAIDPTSVSTLTNGVNATLGSGFAQQIGSLVGLAAVNAAGSLVYRAAAGQQVANNQATQAVINSTPKAPASSNSTLLLLAGGAIVLFLILKK